MAYPDWLRGDWQLTNILVDLAHPVGPDLVTMGFKGNHTQVEQPVSARCRSRL